MPVATAVVGRGVEVGFLTNDQVREIAQNLSTAGQSPTPDNILKWYLRLLAVGAIR